jgi:hypothetical protein
MGATSAGTGASAAGGRARTRDERRVAAGTGPLRGGGGASMRRVLNTKVSGSRVCGLRFRPMSQGPSASTSQ